MVGTHSHTYRYNLAAYRQISRYFKKNVFLISKGEKPFACDTCDMKFKCKEGLKTHQWTHTGGKKPYNCLICQKGFMRKAFLNKHNCAGPNSIDTSDDEDDRVLASFRKGNVHIVELFFFL
jgi:uncharacterized Zn-finger protein